MEIRTADLLRRAAAHLKAGERAQAPAVLAEAVHHEPGCEEAWTMLGMALEEPEKKVFAFKKALAINPGFERARRQLERLEQPPERPEWLKPAPELPPQPEAPDPLVEDEQETPHPAGSRTGAFTALLPYFIGGGLLLAVILIGLAAYWLWSAPPARPVPTRIPLPQTPVSGLAATGLPPTWTPTLSPTPAPTRTTAPDFTPTWTVTGAPLPLLPAVQTQIAVIQQQVSQIRGLDIREGVENELMPLLKLRLLVTDLFIDDAAIARLEKDRIVLSALGFIDPGYDLVTASLNGAVDGIGGFYFPENNKVHVIGTSLGGIEQYIYSHEYAHALADMHYDLTSLGVYPECLRPQQHCMAIRALVEGDATYVEELWYLAYGGNLTFSWAGRSRPTDLFQSDDPVPPYFTIHGAFPYYFGAYFIDSLYREGGWELVNRAWRERLPATTEQIMHPEKYLRAEGGQTVSDPALEALLGSDWALVERDTLGEWETALLLSYPLAPAAQRDDTEAFIAAAGWGGDSYQVYHNAALNQTAMTVHWTWDTPADQDEFWNSLRASLAGRYANAAFDGPGNGECWLALDQFTCIYQTERDVLWLLAPSPELLEGMKAVFPQFP
ncbi:MAG: hypothetical protein HYZ26_14715 [Chloroflexi bacterium]|nr:hypothetical protein [Chloroflexota bacterium]